MSVPAGSEGLTRKSTADWLTDTKTYLQGERLLDIDTGEQRVSSGGTYAQAWKNLPYLSYVAAISQGGTDAPTVDEVLSNSLGITPVFARAGSGVYSVASTGAFPEGRTAAHIYGLTDGDTSSIGAIGDAIRADDDTVNILTVSFPAGSASDGYLNKSILEIKVYNP